LETRGYELAANAQKSLEFEPQKAAALIAADPRAECRRTKPTAFQIWPDRTTL